jgi:hypothetical protein
MSEVTLSKFTIPASVRRTVVSRASLVAVSALALVALTGCAPASTGGPAPSHSAAPSTNPIAQLTTPRGVTCNDLAPLATAQPQLASTDDSANQAGVTKYGRGSWTHCDPSTG